MKKIILIAISVIGLSGISQAQEVMKANPDAEHREKLTPEQHAQKSVARLNEKVGLTEDQKTKVTTLAIDKAKKTDEIRTKYSGQADKRPVAKSEMDAVRKEYRKQVKALLTPEQIEKLKAHHKSNATGKTESLEVEDMIEG